MNLVDSSGWLEFFSGTAGGKHFASAIGHVESLIVPTLVLYEVFKRMLIERGERAALRVSAHMMTGIVVALDEKIALEAAVLSVQHKLALADSIILATARRTRATLWTQDEDFKGLPAVRYFKK